MEGINQHRKGGINVTCIFAPTSSKTAFLDCTIFILDAKIS